METTAVRGTRVRISDPGTWHESVDVDVICVLGSEDAREGICVSCGEVDYGVDPDTEGAVCPVCGEAALCGPESLTYYVMGL